MSKQDNLTDFLTDVADAIREKKGTTEKINPQNFSEEIRGIESGGGGNAYIEYADETIFGKDSYKNVLINEGVTSIGDYSFYYAKNVENVTLPSTLESIGDRCFAYSTIRDINLSDNIKSIGTYAFSRCPNLKRYVHPRGIDTVPERVCDYCTGLEYVYFPNTVKTVNPYAFYGNNSNGIFIAEDVESWVNIEFKGTTNQMPLPNVYIANSYFGSVDSVVEDISLESMSSVELQLFRNFKNIKNVRFSENLQSIGTAAFYSSSVVSVELGGCTSIGSQTFHSCETLESIDISNVTSIADRAFYNCVKLKVPMKFNPSWVSIKTYAFYGCLNIPYFDFREHHIVPTLDSYAFATTAGEIVVPDNLYDEWIAATNWSAYASRIVKASEFVEPTNE